MVLEIVVLVVAMVTVGFAAAAEIALALVDRRQLQTAVEQGVRRARTVRLLLDDTERALSTLLLAQTAAVAAATGAALLLARRIRADWLGLLVGFLLLVVILVGVRVICRALAARSPDTWALRLAWAVQAQGALLTPLIAIMRRLGTAVRGPTGETCEESIFLTEDGLRFLINVGEEEGNIEEDEKEMIASIVELSDTLVREVMVPRMDVVSLPVDTPIPDALDVIIAAGYSRIPIFEETIDNIVGVLYAKDLLGYFRYGQKDKPISTMLRSAYFVPESMKVDDLLHELQRRRVHMALVVDEYGGTAGLATIEDLLEEIVGEIQDEYDVEEPLVKELGEGEYVLHARCNLDDASDVLGVSLPSEGGDTLGGFLYTQMGRVPEVGDEVLFHNVRMTVLSVEGRSVKQVRAEFEVPEQEEPETGNGHGPPSGPLSFPLLR